MYNTPQSKLATQPMLCDSSVDKIVPKTNKQQQQQPKKKKANKNH